MAPFCVLLSHAVPVPNAFCQRILSQPGWDRTIFFVLHGDALSRTSVTVLAPVQSKQISRNHHGRVPNFFAISTVLAYIPRSLSPYGRLVTVNMVTISYTPYLPVQDNTFINIQYYEFLSPRDKILYIDVMREKKIDYRTPPTWVILVAASLVAQITNRTARDLAVLRPSMPISILDLSSPSLHWAPPVRLFSKPLLPAAARRIAFFLIRFGAKREFCHCGHGLIAGFFLPDELLELEHTLLTLSKPRRKEHWIHYSRRLRGLAPGIARWPPQIPELQCQLDRLRGG